MKTWTLDGRSLALIALVVVGLVGSQLCVKAGLSRSGGVHLSGDGALESIWKTAREPALWAGFAITGLATLLWLGVLSHVDLSIAYPMISSSYVLMLFASRWLYKEPITAAKLAGVLFICVGVALMTRR